MDCQVLNKLLEYFNNPCPLESAAICGALMGGFQAKSRRLRKIESGFRIFPNLIEFPHKMSFNGTIIIILVFPLKRKMAVKKGFPEWSL
jgi:hypothetical protein